MGRQLKIKQHYKLIWGVGILCIATAVLAVVLVARSATVTVSCSSVLNNAANLSKHNHSKQAYQQLKADAATCTSVSAQAKLSPAQLTKAKVQVVSYDMALASAALLNKDRQQAYQSADRAAQIIQAMSPTQRAQIPNSNSIVLQIISLQTMQKISQSKL